MKFPGSGRHKAYLTAITAGIVVCLLVFLFWLPVQQVRQLKLRNDVFPEQVVQVLLDEMRRMLPDTVITLDQPDLRPVTRESLGRPADIIFSDTDFLKSYGALEQIPLARDGVAILVHAENPIRELMARDLEEIFLRKLRNWKLVGGVDGEIDLLRRSSGYAEMMAVVRHYNIPVRRSIETMRGGHSKLVIDKVAGQAASLGFASLVMALQAQQQLPSLKLLAVDGVDPGFNSLQDRTYPLHRALGIGLTESCIDLLPLFQKLAASEPVQQALREAAYLSISGHAL